ncbi:hypothetical protein B0H16DRAFT_1466376 [Mycena metata]|uniref:Uncharacterized protein n=1 Tax=Mycena metata TaxID=1033252 RepID=A0AAD7MY37_9AGAR|nr:hypothetical protein B0H16DRAFT_1466376 [Mycena metata]
MVALHPNGSLDLITLSGGGHGELKVVSNVLHAADEREPAGESIAEARSGANGGFMRKDGWEGSRVAFSKDIPLHLARIRAARPECMECRIIGQEPYTVAPGERLGARGPVPTVKNHPGGFLVFCAQRSKDGANPANCRSSTSNNAGRASKSIRQSTERARRAGAGIGQKFTSREAARRGSKPEGAGQGGGGSDASGGPKRDLTSTSVNTTRFDQTTAAIKRAMAPSTTPPPERRARGKRGEPEPGVPITDGGAPSRLMSAAARHHALISGAGAPPRLITAIRGYQPAARQVRAAFKNEAWLKV